MDSQKEFVKECLIIFTRYPEPGKTKTRLIPTLGPEGAAILHRQMTEHTLSQARAVQMSALSVEVCFTGGDRCLMESWLGTDLSYQHQSQGDLGARMTKAFELAFQVNARVVTIGTDCPGLNAQLLAKVFQELHHHDLVLGPAMDGGYYLIGLRRFIPELFKGINWGTAEVFQQTIDIAEQLNLSIACLTPLEDIDRPENLANLNFELPILDDQSSDADKI